jgi:uncharacterized protein YndB with AHSA1/START domain
VRGATMVLADGNEIPWKGVYREVVEPERLVLTLSDQPGEEAEILTITFTALGDRTEMVFHQVGGHLTEEEYRRAQQGWSGFFDRLAELLPPA